MFNAFLHGGRRLISTSWSWSESSCKLCMTQNVHIVVVEYRTYDCIACTRNAPRVMWHVKKRSSKGQRTWRLPLISVDELFHPSYQRRVFVSQHVIACNSGRTLNVISFSLQLYSHWWDASCYLLLYQTESCAKFCMKWRRRITRQCEGKWKWSSCLASWCVDPWSMCLCQHLS